MTVFYGKILREDSVFSLSKSLSFFEINYIIHYTF